jgi:DNA-binding HxlR family transcriptional regulator
MPRDTTRRATPTPLRVEQIRVLLRSGEGARALRHIGDRWSFLILRDAFLGARRFEDFRRQTGAARGTLAARLAALVDLGVFYRNPYGSTAGRFEYRLTDKGRAFYPIALCLWSWESRWGGEFGLPPRLTHTACGHRMQPLLVCAHCGAIIERHDVTVEIGPGARSYATESAETRRRSVPAVHAKGVDTTMFHSVDTIGDRWSCLVLAAFFLGLHRYDDISAAMGIATNILSDRLRRLLSAGVIEQHLYRERPPRYQYRLTEKGWALYPFSIALHDWASRWIPAPEGPAIRLRHMTCGHTLRSRIICSECRGPIEPHEVSLRATPRRRPAAAPRRGPQAARRVRGGSGKKPLVRST